MSSVMTPQKFDEKELSDFRQWFEKMFVMCEPENYMRSKDAYAIYKMENFPFYSKAQKRKYNLKWFREITRDMMRCIAYEKLINVHCFDQLYKLADKMYYKDRHRLRVNGTQIDVREVILGWKFKF